MKENNLNKHDNYGSKITKGKSSGIEDAYKKKQLVASTMTEQYYKAIKFMFWVIF